MHLIGPLGAAIYVDGACRGVIAGAEDVYRLCTLKVKNHHNNYYVL